MKRFSKWLLALGGAFALLALLLSWGWSWAPPFYRPATQLLASDPATRQLAKQTDQQALQFLDELRHEPTFTLRLTDRQVNAWLVGEVEPRHPGLWPPGVSQPRLRFQADECVLAARFQPARGPATVASARLRLAVTADHRLGIELVRLQAGWFPLPPESLVEPLVKQLEQGGIPSEWRQIEGRDVLTLDLFATPWVRERLESGDPRLEQITLREGELELTGRRSP
ncbi:MAG: hypothetical protein ACKOGA_20895 [Planctomycetaceae bacterium]